MISAGIEQLFARLEYERDVRHPPDERRRGQFRAGWEDATERGDVYATETLERLTWHNLGYRFGKHFGHQSSEKIDQAFEALARLHEPDGPSAWQVPAAAPSPQQYVAAFRKVSNLADSHIQMLRMHYHAPDRTITATEMTRAAGYNHYSFANSQYGRLGRLVGEQLDYNPMQERLGTLVTFDKRQGEWHWLMRPEVAQALESCSAGSREPTCCPRRSRQQRCWSKARPVEFLLMPTSGTQRPASAVSGITGPTAVSAGSTPARCMVSWPRAISIFTTSACCPRSAASTLSIRSRTCVRCVPTATRFSTGAFRCSVSTRFGRSCGSKGAPTIALQPTLGRPCTLPG
jgi:hypothetical protein